MTATAHFRPADKSSARPAAKRQGHESPRQTWATPLTLPWWSSPAGLAIGFLMPVIFLISAAGGADHPGVTVRGLIFLDSQMLALAAYMLVVLGVGGWLGSGLHLSRTHGEQDIPSQKGWDVAAFVIGIIALAAYCLWFQNYVFNPVLMWQTIIGEHKPGRDSIILMPGFTSFSNFGPPFFAIVTYRWFFQAPGEKISRPLLVLTGILICFTIFRVYAWSERLSLIEACAPMSLAFGARIARWADDRSQRGAGGTTRSVGESSVMVMPWGSVRAKVSKVLSMAGPYAAIPFVIILFGIFEYFRSWETDTYKGKMDFWDFAIGRFISYYYTSLNNGAGLVKISDAPTWDLAYVLEWVYKGPWGPGLPVFFNGTPSVDFEQFLVLYGDPEFNSPSGIYAILSDLGYVGGSIYMFVVGVVAGLLYRAFRTGKFWGVALYPSMLVMFAEIFRYPYLGTPRAFTVLLGVVMAAFIVAVTRQMKKLQEKA